MRVFDNGNTIPRIVALVLAVGWLATAAAQNDARKLTGMVTDADGAPLAGATITLKNSTQGTSADVNGVYSINVPRGGVLVFSFLGYQSQEVIYRGQERADVTLLSDEKNINAVVVVGYGTQRKRDVTGSIAMVKTDQLSTTVAAANPLQGLQGKVAGVEVVSDAAPGGAPQIRIRGVSSFTNSNPCYVVDGLIVDGIAFINPSEIESMQVLKDASATAIYGSRGANGVIIITTKQGRKNQKMQLTVDANVSVSEMERYLPYATASQYLELKNRDVMARNAIDGSSLELPYSPAEIKAAGKGTDWQREVTRHAVTHNYNINIIGGGDKATYGVTAGYFNQQGIMKYSDYQRASIKISNTYDLTKWAVLGSNISYIYELRHSQGTSLSSTLNALPTAPVRDPDDPSRFFGPVDQIGKSGNPVASNHYNSDNFANYYKTLANLYLNVNFTKNLVLRSSFTLNSSNSQNKSFSPRFQVNDEQKRVDNGLSIGQGRSLDWLNENTLTYTFEKGKHNLTALIGITFQRNDSQNLNLSISGMPDTAWKNRNLWYKGLGDSSTLAGGSGGAVYTYLSYLARVNYSFANKYLVTATLRTDGSSRFPVNGRYGTFPALGLGWTVSEEGFMKDVRWLNQLKLRASYGVVGSDAGIPNNIQTAYVNRVNGVFGLNPESVTTTEALDMVVDYGLHWEEARQFNIGLDLLALDNRLSLEADYYVKTTKDILTNVNLPGVSGTGHNPLSNIATARNQGFEFNLGWNDNVNGIDYRFNLIGTTLKNKVTSVNRNLPPLENGANRTLVGYPIGGFWGYEVLGIYQYAETVAQTAHIDGAGPGDIWYRDQNGDGVIDKEDRIYMGSYLPKVTLGFNTMMRYKGFELNLDLYASLGSKIYCDRRMRLSTPPYNLPDEHLQSWTGVGTTNTHTRVLLDGTGTNGEVSEFYLENGSYFKIRNLVLGYNLPRRAVTKMRMQNLKVYLAVNNLLTATKASGYSPEIGGGPNGAGVDRLDGVYPHARMYSVGLNIVF